MILLSSYRRLVGMSQSCHLWFVCLHALLDRQDLNDGLDVTTHAYDQALLRSYPLYIAYLSQLRGGCHLHRLSIYVRPARLT